MVEAHSALSSASVEFLTGDYDRVAILRRALRGQDRQVGLFLARSVPLEEKLALFPEWILLASFVHGALDVVREIILSLPRDWVVARIEDVAEPFLAEGDSIEYFRFLELYYELDSDLVRKLAIGATAHDDEEIREAGHLFLSKLAGRE